MRTRRGEAYVSSDLGGRSDPRYDCRGDEGVIAAVMPVRIRGRRNLREMNTGGPGVMAESCYSGTTQGFEVSERGCKKLDAEAGDVRNDCRKITSVEVLDVWVDAMTEADFIWAVARAIDEQRQCIIANHNVHSWYLWSREPRIRTLYMLADYVQIDGMPLVWVGRLLGLPLRTEHRNTNFDLLPGLARECVRRRARVFYLGSKPDVAARAVEKLQARYPGLQMKARDGFFDATKDGRENQDVLHEIRCYDPDILMVGMGMPRQEIWLAENVRGLNARVVLCCGGLMDLVAGEIPTAPRWLGPIGLEWLYRLLSEPRRLWRRYLLEPWSIGARMAVHYGKRCHLRWWDRTSVHYPQG